MATQTKDSAAKAEKAQEKQVKVTVKHSNTVQGKRYHRGEQMMPESHARSLGLLADEDDLPVSDPRFKRPAATGGPAVPDSKDKDTK